MKILWISPNKKKPNSKWYLFQVFWTCVAINQNKDSIRQAHTENLTGTANDLEITDPAANDLFANITNMQSGPSSCMIKNTTWSLIFATSKQHKKSIKNLIQKKTSTVSALSRIQMSNTQSKQHTLKKSQRHIQGQRGQVNYSIQTKTNSKSTWATKIITHKSNILHKVGSSITNQ